MLATQEVQEATNEADHSEGAQIDPETNRLVKGVRMNTDGEAINQTLSLDVADLVTLNHAVDTMDQCGTVVEEVHLGETFRAKVTDLAVTATETSTMTAMTVHNTNASRAKNVSTMVNDQRISKTSTVRPLISFKVEANIEVAEDCLNKTEVVTVETSEAEVAATCPCVAEDVVNIL